MTDNSWPTADDLLVELYYPESKQPNDLWERLEEQIGRLKKAAVECGNEREANRYWCAHLVLNVQCIFVESFLKIKQGQYYEGWCSLEKCEVALEALMRHYEIDQHDCHRLRYIQRMVGCWQRLYPYKLFASTELLKRRVTCSICKEVISPRGGCGHKKGGLYWGEMCRHVIEKADIVSISVVHNPVHKYAVSFLSGKDGAPRDHYDYGIVKYVSDRVTSPFHEWTSTRTTRTLDAAEVARLSGGAQCPCESGKLFKQCCADEPSVEVPHTIVEFTAPVPAKLLRPGIVIPTTLPKQGRNERCYYGSGMKHKKCCAL